MNRTSIQNETFLKIKLFKRPSFIMQQRKSYATQPSRYYLVLGSINLFHNSGRRLHGRVDINGS
jgi:hypothetical protein